MKNLLVLISLLFIIGIANSKELEQFNVDFSDYVGKVIITPNSSFKAFLSDREYIIIRKLPSDSLYDVCQLFKYSGSTLSIRFLNDSIMLVNNFTDSLKKFIYKYNIHSKKVIDTITILDRSMTFDDTRFYFSKNSKSLYVLRTFAYIDKYDMETGEFVGEIVNPTPWDHIWQFAVSDDEQSFAYAFNEYLQILDKDGKLIHQFNNLDHFNFLIYLPCSGNILVTYFPDYSSMRCYSINDSTINIKIEGSYNQVHIDSCIYIINNCNIISFNTYNNRIDSLTIPDALSINNIYVEKQDIKCYAYDSGYTFTSIYNITQKKYEMQYFSPVSSIGILSNNALLVRLLNMCNKGYFKFYSYELPVLKSNHLADISFPMSYNGSVIFRLMPGSDIFTYPEYVADDSSSNIMTYNFLTKETKVEGIIKDSVNYAYFTKNKEYLYYYSEKSGNHFINWNSKEVILANDKSILDIRNDISPVGKYYKTNKEIISSESKQVVCSLTSKVYSTKWANYDSSLIIMAFEESQAYNCYIYNSATMDSLYCLTTDPVHGKFLSIPSLVFEIFHDRYLLLEYEDSTFLLFDIVNLRKVEEFTYPHGIVQILGFTSDLLFCYGYCDGFFTVWRTGLPNAVEEQPEAKTTSEISVSPNPTEDFSTVNVFSEKKGIVRLKIHTITGLQIFDFQGEKSDGLFTNQIDLSTFPSGVYFINVYLNEEFFGCRKIIKQ